MVKIEPKPNPNSPNDSAAAQDVILRNRAKVGDVGQQIHDSDKGQGNWISELDRTNGIPDFGEDVVRATITYKRPGISHTSASQKHGP